MSHGFSKEPMVVFLQYDVDVTEAVLLSDSPMFLVNGRLKHTAFNNDTGLCLIFYCRR